MISGIGGVLKPRDWSKIARDAERRYIAGLSAREGKPLRESRLTLVGVTAQREAAEISDRARLNERATD